MSKLLSGFDTGICTILPESCYPLEGVITIKDENDNTVTVGEFCLNRGHEELKIKTNIRQVYFPVKKDKDDKLCCNPSDYLNNNYKYELVAQAKITHEGTTTTNVQMNGIGMFSGDCEVSIGDFFDAGQLKAKFYPLHNGGDVCNLRIW